jgi:hypothetical protein
MKVPQTFPSLQGRRPVTVGDSTLMQEPAFACGDGRAYYCPADPGVLHRGWSGSKLVVFLGSMVFDDAKVASCSGGGT